VASNLDIDQTEAIKEQCLNLFQNSTNLKAYTSSIWSVQKPTHFENTCRF